MRRRVGSPSDLAFASVGELAHLLRARQVSAVELAELSLQRLSTLGESYAAVAELTPEVALADARRADRRLRGPGPHRPLLGIPFGAKDLFATKGIPTRWGAPPYRDQVFDHDATAIARLRAAGAVLVAKLAMIELAGAGVYSSPAASLNGACRNPWSTGHWTGGSSSGSGAAVSAGLVPFSIASDTRGSITTPSAFCGVTGLRPTFGAVSRYGAMALAWSMDKVGPMARTAADCATVLATICGRDALDPLTAEWAFRPTRRRSFTVGVLPLHASTSDAVASAFDAALRTLRGIGVTTRRVALPDGDHARIAQELIAAETLAAHGDLLSDGSVDELVDAGQREGLRRYALQPTTAYVRAWERRIAATRALAGLFRQVDAIAAPTMPTEAFRIDVQLSDAPRYGLSGLLGAVCGVPAVSVPMGFGVAGLPLGLSLVAGHFREAVLLRLADLFQRSTEWHRRRPPGTDDGGPRSGAA